MNRIILIGNGFDLAHGLQTGYKHFIDKYWSEFAIKIYDKGVFRFYEDNFVEFKHGAAQSIMFCSMITPDAELNSYSNLLQLIQKHIRQNVSRSIGLFFKNEFWKHISEIPTINTWLDIENEYYCLLKKYVKAENRKKLVQKLNRDFNQVKKLLEEYLTEVCKQEIQAYQSINNAIKQPLNNREIANSKKEMLIRENYGSHLLMSYQPNLLVKRFAKENDKLQNIIPKRTLFLNFNYTNTVEKLYANPKNIINIHGQLNDQNNSIIFGYGDELDEDHKTIVNLNDNDYLENIKSISYLKTDNYRKLLDFINSESYQILIMGHSCGNSDRTLLNTLFEHPNCISIKPYYYIKNDGSDNYIEIIQNIYRNFKDMALMRDIVVNKSYCQPLIVH